MTYLQLVNRVLRRLREKTVSGVNDNDYATLVGDFVNDAKGQVEGAWNWKALRTEITFNTVAGTSDYDLGDGGVGSGETTEDSTLMLDHRGQAQVWNTTLKTQLSLYPLEYIRGLQRAVSPNSQPDSFAVISGATGLTLRIYPAPDAVYAMAATFVIPQAELTSNSTVLLVPSEPVWKLALALAAAERGTGLGEMPTALLDAADRALADAIVAEAEALELTAFPA